MILSTLTTGSAEAALVEVVISAAGVVSLNGDITTTAGTSPIFPAGVWIRMTVSLYVGNASEPLPLVALRADNADTGATLWTISGVAPYGTTTTAEAAQDVRLAPLNIVRVFSSSAVGADTWVDEVDVQCESISPPPPPPPTSAPPVPQVVPVPEVPVAPLFAPSPLAAPAPTVPLPVSVAPSLNPLLTLLPPPSPVFVPAPVPVSTPSGVLQFAYRLEVTSSLDTCSYDCSGPAAALAGSLLCSAMKQAQPNTTVFDAVCESACVDCPTNRRSAAPRSLRLGRREGGYRGLEARGSFAYSPPYRGSTGYRPPSGASRQAVSTRRVYATAVIRCGQTSACESACLYAAAQVAMGRVPAVSADAVVTCSASDDAGVVPSPASLVVSPPSGSRIEDWLVVAVLVPLLLLGCVACCAVTAALYLRRRRPKRSVTSPAEPATSREFGPHTMTLPPPPPPMSLSVPPSVVAVSLAASPSRGPSRALSFGSHVSVSEDEGESPVRFRSSFRTQSQSVADRFGSLSPPATRSHGGVPPRRQQAMYTSVPAGDHLSLSPTATHPWTRRSRSAEPRPSASGTVLSPSGSVATVARPWGTVIRGRDGSMTPTATRVRFAPSPSSSYATRRRW
eukprot:TRINITY_DN67598_c0_g1_i1.p1 TRINITY_DN67598_c0_g1~~TRINITY_DN67598_c0_g1_i1.p1  ORF type:complete len:685 (+),score=70.28 TRINITY_DN67598_c0_g1_i1:192-2057(+)